MFYEKSLSEGSPNPAQGPLLSGIFCPGPQVHTHTLSPGKTRHGHKRAMHSACGQAGIVFTNQEIKGIVLYVKLSTCVNTVEKPAIRFIDKRLYLLVTFYT
jgi:hypothetical protein